MNNKKVKKAIKVYNVIGKVLCASAGGIVGFMVAGPFGAIPGALLGGLAGHFIEKGTIQFPKKPKKSSV